MNIALIDFDDSFTANIAEVLSRLNHSVSWYSWRELDAKKIRKDYDVVLLGPGPGHVLDYSDCFNEIENLKGFPVIGICLGHQILLHLEGVSCRPMDRPIHGKSLSFKNSGHFLNIPDLYAQSYNSWAIYPEDIGAIVDEVNCSLVFDNGFLAIYHKLNWIGCQFHPESVGTSYPNEVLQSLLKKICIIA